MTDTFDYLIIGSGTAGSVIAGRLSAGQRGTVCVLEAGPRDRNPFIHVPAGVAYTLKNPRINWMYETEPGDCTGGRRIAEARGRTLGGSGSINGHIYNRGHRMDFETWAQRGNRGWSYAEVLPYFKRSENRIGAGDDRYRGRDGPFTITDIDRPNPLSDAFIDGAASLGIPRNPDYNGAVQEGISYAQRSLYRGQRVSPARAFLHPAMKRGNLDVRTDAHVQQILFEGKRTVGVRYLRKGHSHTVRARAEVILSAGAIASPQLLQLSGVGPPQLLRSLGLPLVQALPGVGENLRGHYGVPLIARIRGPGTINEQVRGFRLAREVARYAFTRRGVLAQTPGSVYCFWKSDESLDQGDIQITFMPASSPFSGTSGLDRFPGATIGCWQQRPQSVGYVRARSPDPLEHPEIQPNYLEDPNDRRILVAAMRLGRKIMRSRPFAPFVEREVNPGPGLRSEEELMEFARTTGTTTFHPVGTCRMGPEPQNNTVVDEQLRVHGVERLRVADASIMPTITSANTNAATLMIGEKAADLIQGMQPLPAEDV